MTLRQVAAVREHTAPVAVLAPLAGASVRVVDVALDTEPPTGPAAALPGAPGQRADRPGGRADRGRGASAAFEVGRTLADEEVDAGADLLVPAALGVGASTPASVLVAALTGAEPVATIGRGSGIDDAGWMRKAAAVRDALRRARPHQRDPLALLRVAGGADLAALAGFCLQAAARRTPVLLDGLVVGAAALVGRRARRGRPGLVAAGAALPRAGDGDGGRSTWT